MPYKKYTPMQAKTPKTDLMKVSKSLKHEMDMEYKNAQTAKRSRIMRIDRDTQNDTKTIKYRSDAPYNSSNIQVDKYIKNLLCPEFHACITEKPCHLKYTDSAEYTTTVVRNGVHESHANKQDWHQFNILGWNDGHDANNHRQHFSTRLTVNEMYNKANDYIRSVQLSLPTTNNHPLVYPDGSNTQQNYTVFEAEQGKNFIYRGGSYKLIYKNASNFKTIMKFYEVEPRRVTKNHDLNVLRYALLSKAKDAPYIGSNYNPALLDPIVTVHSSGANVGLQDDINEITDLDFKIEPTDEVLHKKWLVHKCKVFTLNAGDTLEYQVDIPSFHFDDNYYNRVTRYGLDSIANGPIDGQVLPITDTYVAMPGFTKMLLVSIKGEDTMHTGKHTEEGENNLTIALACPTKVTCICEEKHNWCIVPWAKSHQSYIINDINSQAFGHENIFISANPDDDQFVDQSMAFGS